MCKVAINGLGRIGRAALKIILDRDDIELVAVNDLVSAENLAYLLRYDTVYGRYDKKVEFSDKELIIEGKSYPKFSEKDPASLPWKDLGCEIVLESTGIFTNREGMQKHLDAGAKKVVLSAPAKSSDVPTVVHGVNEIDYSEDMISCASCTTNCTAPVMEIMDRRIGIKKAIMTTIHAYTASQSIVDGPAKKMRRGRAGAANLVPTSTGAAKATSLTLPQLKNKFDGVAVRGPVPVGSITDINFIAKRATSADEINKIFREEANTDRYRGILGASDDELVSSDIIMDPRASIVDLPMTQVVDGDLVKVMSWYDNEWGYANQMVRETIKVAKKGL
ncbi:MAG: type I glyceraldehyde-3-phosphate dehydrogenase [Candidatus Kapaibacterium sp.]